MHSVNIRWLGRQDYLKMWQAMRSFVAARTPDTLDEIWLLEHESVFTQGQNGKAEHVLDAGDIPVIQTDRGGQVTYHGPGQLMVYVLFDLKRLQLNVRALVNHLENALIATLATQQLNAYAKSEAPGVYVKTENQEFKIASIGLRIRKNYSYHGLALNVQMNLDPFDRIHPCGYKNLQMTHMSKLLQKNYSVLAVGRDLIPFLIKNLSYTTSTFFENHADESHGYT